MNRLTRTAEAFDYCRDFCGAGNCQHKAGIFPAKCLDATIYERLRDYEDAEEEGRLIVLPYKCGDTVFVLNASAFHKNEVYESKISSIHLDAEGMSILGGGFFGHIDRLLNETVFFSREKAEAALKKEGTA